MKKKKKSGWHPECGALRDSRGEREFVMMLVGTNSLEGPLLGQDFK